MIAIHNKFTQAGLLTRSSVECLPKSQYDMQYNLSVISWIYNFSGGHGVFNSGGNQGAYPNILVGLSCSII